MKKMTLGRTGLEVTQLSYGAMELRYPPDGNRKVDDALAEQVLSAVLDGGINFIDTAPDYGLSEERIGRFVSSRRKEYFLATKCGCDPADKGGQGEHVWKRDQLLRNIDGSLQRLKTDHVDVLQLHNPRIEDAPVDELVEALREIQGQGLTRFIGISTTEPWLDRYLEMGVFDTFQIPYSCLQPQHGDAITRVGEAGAGVVVRGGINRGGPNSETPGRTNQELWDAAGMGEVCDDMSAAEMILRYTLTHPHCHTTIVGTRSLEHLKENVEAAEKGPLPEEIYGEIRRRVEAGVRKINEQA
jgi:aryl-alcohol dehydrogenase-like predicted oxidoreductase